jgi:hypothetical protein
MANDSPVSNLNGLEGVQLLTFRPALGTSRVASLCCECPVRAPFGTVPSAAAVILTAGARHHAQDATAAAAAQRGPEGAHGQ